MDTRRLPIYLLIDCSESMAGAAIDAVNLGLQTLLGELRSNPLALDNAALSVIAFSGKAEQIVPLTDLTVFQMPRLSIRPGTSLGAALRLLSDSLRREVNRTTATTKGDYRPLVFLLTDGQPTDDWRAGVQALTEPGMVHPANIYAIGCGPDVDTEILREITDIVFTIPELSSATIKKFFMWLSASVQTASVKVGTGEDGTGRDKLASLPPEIQEATPGQRYRDYGVPRQVFLHSRCSMVKKPYLMRYVYFPQYEVYQPVAAHPLDELETGEAALLPPINSSLLNGAPACPYCENPAAAMCPCGTLFCAPEMEQGPVVCPGCGITLTGSNTGTFDIQRTEG